MFNSYDLRLNFLIFIWISIICYNNKNIFINCETNAKSFENSLKSEEIIKSTEKLTPINTQLLYKNINNNNKSEIIVSNNNNNQNSSKSSFNFRPKHIFYEKVNNYRKTQNETQIDDKVLSKVLKNSNNNFHNKTIEDVIRRWKSQSQDTNPDRDIAKNDNQINNNNTKESNITQISNNDIIMQTENNYTNNTENNRIIKFLNNTDLFEIVFILVLIAVFVPLIIIICSVIMVWVYRKKYPVRMSFGRKFNTIENPDYKVRKHRNNNSTIVTIESN